MKKDKLVFWAATAVIVLVEGVGNIATANLGYAKQNVYDLGYPEYFRVAMLVLKLLGVVALVLPKVPSQIKEWAYAGFFINTLFAIISYWAVKGFGSDLIFPAIIMAFLMISYVYYRKLSGKGLVKKEIGVMSLS
jgi:uncharacterized membrane protein YphA (DoxX/SURF4 family)